MNRAQGKPMNNARIDRMLRELNSDPSHQFFSAFFGIIGLGKSQPAKARDIAIPVSLLNNAAAR
jgi:predicted house-cleaning NTP pyrophosphatase (Maf/HAM1 superfamily)